MKTTPKALLLSAVTLSAGLTFSLALQAAETVTIATVNNSDMIRMQRLSKTFEEQHPDIKLNWVVLEENVLRQRLTVRGFIQSDLHALFPAFLREMGQWLKDGRVQYREDIVEGLENAPEAFFGLLKGRNFGKLVVKLD